MPDERLDIACWDYDRVKPLREGAVRIEGVEASFHSGRIVTDIFEGMIRRRAYDVAELGLTYFLRTFEAEDAPFRLLPVFLVRAFRHGGVYVHKASGVNRPEDLAGKRIGELALYGHDAGVMAKGALSDAYGLDPGRCRWIVGGIDFPLEPIDYVPHSAPDGVEIEWASRDVDLGDMLERGEIDALISADVPRCVLDGSPKVGRLFPDYEAVEREYYRQTGVFPIMHAVAVKRELAERRPDLVRAVYDGFCAAKTRVAEGYARGMTFNNMTLMTPWLTPLMERNLELLGRDWWPYGVGANRAALEAVLRYHHEQGLTRRRYTVDEIIAPGLLDT